MPRPYENIANVARIFLNVAKYFFRCRTNEFVFGFSLVLGARAGFFGVRFASVLPHLVGSAGPGPAHPWRKETNRKKKRGQQKPADLFQGEGVLQ